MPGDRSGSSTLELSYLQERDQLLIESCSCIFFQAQVSQTGLPDVLETDFHIICQVPLPTAGYLRLGSMVLVSRLTDSGVLGSRGIPTEPLQASSKMPARTAFIGPTSMLLQHSSGLRRLANAWSFKRLDLSIAGAKLIFLTSSHFSALQA